MSYQEDLILSIYNRGEPGLAMGNIPPGKGGSPGQPYEPPKPTGPYVPAPPRPKLASTPQDGKIPTRPFYNRPYEKPDRFIKTDDMKKDATERFKNLTGIDLAGAPNFPGGGFTTTSGAFVDLNGEAYYLDGGELIPEGGYDPAIHGDLIPQGGPDRVMNNQDMMIAQGPELGGTGRLLTIGEYNQAVDTGFSNLMSSDMTQKDFDDYLKIKETAKRQMLDGV